ncbi:MAG: winged helix DNA-binding domain-containing protein [Ruminococcaceae bacterium]|nr:winged helix DNA-binding domain-containing protein [Oscillospiraceae bacterium]
MTMQELRMLQLQHSHLLSPVSTQQVLQDLCGLQAQFFSNALHALRIRSSDEPQTTAFIKSWTLRGTMHVFVQEDLPLFFHEGRTIFLRTKDTMQTDEWITSARKSYFSALVLDLLQQGEKTREELKSACFAAGMTEREAESVFDPWGGLLRALCGQGKICHVAQEKKAFRRCPAFVPMDEQRAKRELFTRYFTHYGPATIRDAAYFFKTTQAEVKFWLSLLPVQTAEVDGRTYYWLPGTESGAAELPECLFLAGFDPLLLGHEKSESLFLPPEHLRGIFNLAGIVNPAVLLHGRVVGKWKRTGKKLSVTLFEPVSERDRKALEEAAHHLWPDIASVLYP